MEIHAERADEETAGPAERGDTSRLARSLLLDPATEERSRRAEKKDPQGERNRQRADLPVVGRGLGDADRPAERNPEDTQAVRHADRQVNGKCRRRDRPAVEVGLRDDSLLDRKSTRLNSSHVSESRM